MTISTTLIDWAAACASKDRYPFLLIDSAQKEGSHLWLERCGVAYASLFDGKGEASLREIAPLLIPLAPLETKTLSRVCSWAADIGMEAPCLSWMDSSHQLSTLASHLGNFHTIGLTDGQRILMRWYDTRILPVWMACLTPVQRQQFAGTLYTLHFLNRFGSPVAVYDTAGPTSKSESLPLDEPLIKLDDAQFGMLIDAGELDSLVHHLRRVITDETNRLEPRTLFEFAGKYQQRARAAGIDDLDRQTQYLLLALCTSGYGVDHPACVQIMESPPAALHAFFDAMQNLPDEAWYAGPPLWSQALSPKAEMVVTLPHERNRNE